jgi:multiple sugar transport system ATP-binding protein
MGDRVAVMSLGELQQVDSPQRLYDHPENLFVAGFIGTPPMNLIEADVRKQNGSVAVSLAGQTVELSDETLKRYPGVAGYEGRPIVFGIRSDDLHLASSNPNLPSLTAPLQLTEALGSTTMAYFKLDANAVRSGSGGVEDAVEEEGEGEGVTATRPNFVASLTAREALDLRIADNVPLAVDVAQAHLFDRDTGAPLR